METKKRLTQREIDEFECKYCMASPEFMSKFEQGELGDSQDCFEWWGLKREIVPDPALCTTAFHIALENHMVSRSF